MRMKTGRGFLLITLLIAFSALAAGCGGGGGDNDGNGNGNNGGGGGDNGGTTPTLTGLWRNTSISAQGQTASCPGQVSVNGQLVRQCGQNDTLEFYSDGTWMARGVTQGTLLRPTRHPNDQHIDRVRGTWSLQGANFGFFISDFASDDNHNNSIDAEEVVPVSPPRQVTIAVNFTARNQFTMRYTHPGTGAEHTDTFQKLE